jgi:hypothetical protein
MNGPRIILPRARRPEAVGEVNPAPTFGASRSRGAAPSTSGRMESVLPWGATAMAIHCHAGAWMPKLIANLLLKAPIRTSQFSPDLVTNGERVAGCAIEPSAGIPNIFGNPGPHRLGLRLQGGT